MSDIKGVLKRYQTASRAEADPASLVSLIERYNLPWFGPPCLATSNGVVAIKQSGLALKADERAICYRSLLRGDERNPILHKIRKLAALPQFYRLNWIRQLSTTSLSVNLDGTHNRLSHSLGTLDIASRFVKALGDECGVVESKAILLYAFIHDSFHGPMGHTMDLIKDVIWGARVEERIDKHLLLFHIEEATQKKGFLWDAVLSAKIGKDESECQAIFEYIEQFVTGDSMTKNFMAEIVDSDLDADRLDYIWRDHIHLMEGSLDDKKAEIEDLIESVSVIEEPRGEKHLYYDAVHEGTITDLLDLRVKFYTKFYEHPLKIVADEMLAHAIYYVLEGEGVLSGSGELAQAYRQLAEQFAYLTDDGLFHFLTEVTSKECHIIPYAIMQDLRANRPFEVVCKGSLKRENFYALTERYRVLDHELESIVREEMDNIRAHVRGRVLNIFNQGQYRAIIEKFNARIIEPVFVQSDGSALRGDPGPGDVCYPYTREDDLYWLQFLYGGSFRKKMLLERQLWKRLQAKEDRDGKFRDALSRVALALNECRPSARGGVEDVIAAVKKTPLVFLTLSWIPGISDQELRNHKRGLSRNGLRLQTDGVPIHKEIELTVKSADTDYNVTLSAPAVLLEGHGVKEFIAGVFEEFLQRREWAIPDALEEGLFWD